MTTATQGAIDIAKALDQFRAALLAADIEPPEHIEADGKLHRCNTTAKNGRDDAAYVLHLDGLPAGGYQNHQDGAGWQNWRADIGRPYTAAETNAYKSRIEEGRKQREAEAAQRRARAKNESATQWAEAVPAQSHPYLERKGVAAHGLRVSNDSLLVPMRDTEGQLHSLQTIAADGTKRFQTGGRKQGCFFTIGEMPAPDGILCIVEGFATGASVHEATGYAVAVAFDAGNLLPVAQALHEKHPAMRLAICADDDYQTEGNTGLSQGREAAKTVGAVLVVPDFGNTRPYGATDFNDLHQAQGLGTVADCLHMALRGEPEPSTIETPAPVPFDNQRDTGGVALIPASSLQPKPIKWLWKEWLAAGKLHILAGAPGQGKTTLAMAFAATVSMGGVWPDHQRARAGNVLIWSGEDDPSDTLTPRLAASGADLTRCHFIGESKDGNGQSRPFDPACDMPKLQKAIEQLGGVSLLIFDPIVSAVTGDSHKNTEVRRAMQPLVDMAADMECAILGITHFSKGGKDTDPAQRVVGSVAFTAVARVVLVAAKTTDAEGNSKRVLARSKSNIGADDGGFEYHLEQVETHKGVFASRVAWGQAVNGSAKELLADPDSGEGNASDAADTLAAEMAGGGWHAAKDCISAMAALGFSKKQTWSAGKKLAVIRKNRGKKDGWFWRLPASSADSIDSIDSIDSQELNGESQESQESQAPQLCSATATMGREEL